MMLISKEFRFAVIDIFQYIFEPGKRAGRRGEIEGTKLIKEVLRDGDYLFSNVHISYDGKFAELDNVVINENGVFIIEVKSYSGYLYGYEKDRKWEKIKMTESENTYKQEIDNPIRQVKRQTYILSNFLRERNLKTYIKSYVLLINKNAPCESRYLLEDSSDINWVIHLKSKKIIDKEKLEDISKVLKKCERGW